VLARVKPRTLAVTRDVTATDGAGNRRSLVRKLEIRR
jgi:hypothetical protein